MRQDSNQVLNLIYQVYEIEILEENKKKLILAIFEGLRKNEEFQHLSDSEFFDIVGETFKLDPEFFMKSIYPKMMYWNFSSFLSVKEEVISLVDKLSKEIDLSKP